MESLDIQKSQLNRWNREEPFDETDWTPATLCNIPM